MKIDPNFKKWHEQHSIKKESKPTAANNRTTAVADDALQVGNLSKLKKLHGRASKMRETSEMKLVSDLAKRALMAKKK
jgi:hypothetical protein